MYRIVQGRPEHHSAYRRIVQDAFKQAYRYTIAMDESLFRLCHQVLWEHPDLILAAYTEDEPVGVVYGYERSLLVDEESLLVCHIGPLAVHPSHQRRGLGRGLMEALRAKAGARGHEGLTLATDPRHPPIRLYERLGFRQYSVRVPYIRVLDREALKRALRSPVLSLLVGLFAGRVRLRVDTSGVQSLSARSRPEDVAGTLADLFTAGSATADCLDLPGEERWRRLLCEILRDGGGEVFLFDEGRESCFCSVILRWVVTGDEEIRLAMILNGASTARRVGEGERKVLTAAAEWAREHRCASILHLAHPRARFSRSLRAAGFAKVGVGSDYLMFAPIRDRADRLLAMPVSHGEFTFIP